VISDIDEFAAIALYRLFNVIAIPSGPRAMSHNGEVINSCRNCWERGDTTASKPARAIPDKHFHEYKWAV